MSNKIKIFIVDDSAYIRNFLKSNLKDEFDIVGEAKDGIEALKKVYTLNPDLVILDLMMPKMSGDMVAKAIMSNKPLPIIMLTSLSDSEIKKSFNLLESTVVEIVKKPMELDSNFVNNLTKKIKICKNLKINKVSESLSQYVTMPNNITLKKNYALTIGVSTGGPKTLRNLIPFLTSIENLPIFLIQHIDLEFEKGYSEWIQEFSQKEVILLSKKTVLEDKLYLCSGKFNLDLTNNSNRLYIELLQAEPNQLYFPCIDKIVTNVAYRLKDRLIHLQLTGLGNDGQEGALIAHKLGATIICQKPESAIASSMPKAVADFADYILELHEIKEKILNILSGQ
ncbi:chemotaxis protein CheB [Deferribacterales bacterium Es71-Z0220]|jgi:two-component system chemotaxis response regulator CheB|uniref:chemotaxis protein CheB n=1 Tax=Deferrivibrio essentukiensis TaxID=2880922 RepID=UPI001F606A0B|nr:chemotaxis protein CheB [Deferrivibrio essentukiensis]MBZ4672916.1 hypothetical protein [Deferribacteraceae bacterium]MCB4203887.1 chemotaxis protein CheB [Deferrivibrio essentukiensis]